jgi:hypothetical protein
MQDHQAAENRFTQPADSERVPLPRAIILHEDDHKPQTVGFPALSTKRKIITFGTPLHTRCMSVDGVWCSDCLVLSVWDTGAQLQVRRPRELSDFYLMFTSSPNPVCRRCKTIWTCGDVTEVALKGSNRTRS